MSANDDHARAVAQSWIEGTRAEEELEDANAAAVDVWATWDIALGIMDAAHMRARYAQTPQGWSANAVAMVAAVERVSNLWLQVVSVVEAQAAAKSEFERAARGPR